MGLFCELNINMPLYNASLKPLEPGNSTHDYQHAAKLFVADNLRLAPKQSFLYYVCININQDLITSAFGTGISSQGLSDQYETGMMVKSTDLPKFSLDTKVMNAYNKKTIVQNKINYDPLSMTFHDDAANVVLNFWNDYYTYYYRDSDYESALYRAPSTYDLRQRTKWGYSPRNASLVPFLRDIQIFSLNQKRFTEYRLINPMITGWRHGEHRAADAGGTLECSMTLSYETVKYRTGYVNPADVNGFSLLHYDTSPSPISTSTTNIYTNQGWVGAIEGAARDLARPDGTFGGTGVIGNYLSIQRAYENLKSVNWGTVAQKTLTDIGINIAGGAINGTFNGLVVPTTNGYYGVSSGIYAQNLVNLSGVPGAYGAQSVANGTVNSIYGVANGTASRVATSLGGGVSRVVGGVTGLATNIVKIPLTIADNLITKAGNAAFSFVENKLINPLTNQVETWLTDATTGIGNWFTRLDATNYLESFKVSDIQVFEEQDFGQYTATGLDGSTTTVYYDLDVNRFTTELTDKQIYD